MTMRIFLPIVALGLSTLCPAATSGAPAASAATFRVTVAGAARDSGVITVPAGRVTDAIGDPDFNGCAIVKNKVTTPPFGAYTFEIHVNYMAGTNLMLAGATPHVKQEVDLELYDYRPGVASYAGNAGGISLAFVIGGRLYFNSARTTVRPRNGELDGTISGQDALRSYPTTVSGLTFQADWHCPTVYHVVAS